MSREQSAETLSADEQHTSGPRKPERRDFDFSKPFFNTETAAAYVDCPSPKAFRKWIKRHGIAVGHRGRRLMVARVDLDRALGLAHRRKAS